VIVAKNESPSKFLINGMTTEEYEKAKKFFEFLKGLTKCTHGFLNIDRENFIDLAAAFMKCTPFEAHQILMKMKEYGWLKELKMDYVVVNTE